MEKYLKAAGIAGLAALSVLTGAAAVNSNSTAEPQETQPVQAAMSQSDRGEYILYDQNGYVAVFQGGEAISVTDIETSTLNEHDRELLRLGIAARDKSELLLLLEDLSS